MELNALKAVIDLAEVSQQLDLADLREHRDVDECVASFNFNSSYRKTQKSKLVHALIQPST